MFNKGLSLFGRFFLGSLMCLFVFLSFNFVFSIAFSDTAGYNVYIYDEETAKEELICQHDENDKNEIDCKCSDIPEDKLSKVRITHVSETKQNICYIIAQIFSTVMLTGILYGTVWEVANKDISKVKYQKQKENKAGGFIIGAIASIPSTIVYILLILSSIEVFSPKFLNTYRLLNYHFFAVITFIFGDASTAAQLSVSQIVFCGLLLLYLPIVCGVAYYLGYKDIKLFEKAVYKKK